MSFIINFFSPRKQAAATRDQRAETEMLEDLTNDPLSKFFHAADYEMPACDLRAASNTDEENKIVYEQWRNSRKRFLMNYIERRLVGVDESSHDEQMNGHTGNNEQDDCSFCSEVLDEEFDAHENLDSSQDNSDSQDVNTSEPETQDTQPQSEAKSAESECMLETQPQTQLPTPHFYKTPSAHHKSGTLSNKDSAARGKSTDKSIDTAELVNQSVTKRFFSGIKRKLGFREDAETQEFKAPNSSSKTPDSRGSPCSQRRKKRRRTDDGAATGKKRGLPPTVIPHIGSASHSTTKLTELDLQTKTLQLDLCQVLRVWRLRNCRRMAHPNDGGAHSQDSTQRSSVVTGSTDNMTTTGFESYEDDGPLDTVYKRVLNVEVAQLDLEINPTLSSPCASSLISAPFESGKVQLQKEIERKKRHKVKRVHIFFYNKYAEAMSTLLNEIGKNGDKKKLSYLLSLSHVPAHCIMPLQMSQHDPLLQQYINNPFGDERHGAQSPYCICIGDSCSMKFGGDKLHFDDGHFKIQLAEMPTATEPCMEVKEVRQAIMNASTVRRGGKGYIWEGDSCALIQKYWSQKGWGQPQHPQGGISIIVGDEERRQTEVPTNQIVSNENDAFQNSFAGEGSNSGDQGPATDDGDHIVRPESVKALSTLRSLLNGKKRLKESVTVYAVVLGFSPPSLTSTQEWKMSMVLIDESIDECQLTATTSQGQAGECPQSPSKWSEKKDAHIPCTTVVLFSKNKSHLPVIRSAGDVICCRNAILQSYNNEPQLLCNRKANVVVVRPAKVRSVDAELHNSISHPDWVQSCSCHDGSEQVVHPYISLPLTNSLWRWGQRRLSSHPTMSPNCKISISGLDQPIDNVEMSVTGDLTVVVTAILPCPNHLRRRDTPRGYIRLWDGSGPPRSDPLPPDVDMNTSDTREDPPEKVLVEIEQVLQAHASTVTQKQANIIAAPISLTGRVINAIIWEEELWQLIQKENIAKVGSFIRLRNVNNARLSNGIQCLSVHSRSSLTPLPFDTFEVYQLLKDHDARIQRGATFNTQSAILPGKSLPNDASANEPPSSLKELTSQPAPTTFTAQFNISHTVPQFNPLLKSAMQNLCCKYKDGSPGYRFAFHVSDGSIEIDVLCLGSVADRLIGASARDVIASPSIEKQAVETLNDLLTPSYLFEGEIRSIVGKDRKIYYILKSMRCLETDA